MTGYFLIRISHPTDRYMNISLLKSFQIRTTNYKSNVQVNKNSFHNLKFNPSFTVSFQIVEMDIMSNRNYVGGVDFKLYNFFGVLIKTKPFIYGWSLSTLFMRSHTILSWPTPQCKGSHLQNIIVCNFLFTRQRSLQQRRLCNLLHLFLAIKCWVIMIMSKH